MSVSWPDVSLGEVCEFKYGKSLPGGKRAGGDVPVFGSNGVVGSHNAAITKGATIIVGRKGSFGEVNVSLVPCWPIDTTYYIDKSATKADLKWLAYRLTGLGLTELNKAAAIPGLNREDAYRRRLLLPPLAEQRRIAEVLDRAEALRAKRRDALAQLDTLTQAFFLDLFGDPVPNPKRWPDPKLGGLLTFQQYGPRFYNEPYSVDGIRIVRITDLNEAGTLDFAEMPRLAVSNADRTKYALHPGDLIFARTGATVGKVALIQQDDPPCIAGAYFITMRFVKTLEPVYARAVLMAPSIRAIVAKRSRQAAQQNFSGPGLRQLPMPLPPLELQRDFSRRVSAVEKLKAAHRASLTEMDALFASLQHRAFRGEL
ncbi:MAG: restriction endonuclease subunit S [Acidobacteriota bacterium]